MLTVKMSFFKEESEDKSGLRISTTTNRTLEFDVEDNVSDLDMNSALDFSFGRFGSPFQVTVNGKTSELDSVKKEQVTETRRRIFNLVLDRGYKRKYQSPFTAVKSSRYRAIPFNQQE